MKVNNFIKFVLIFNYLLNGLFFCSLFSFLMGLLEFGDFLYRDIYFHLFIILFSFVLSKVVKLSLWKYILIYGVRLREGSINYGILRNFRWAVFRLFIFYVLLGVGLFLIFSDNVVWFILSYLLVLLFFGLLSIPFVLFNLLALSIRGYSIKGGVVYYINKHWILVYNGEDLILYF